MTRIKPTKRRTPAPAARPPTAFLWVDGGKYFIKISDHSDAREVPRSCAVKNWILQKNRASRWTGFLAMLCDPWGN
jgi:hypothetical protein